MWKGRRCKLNEYLPLNFGTLCLCCFPLSFFLGEVPQELELLFLDLLILLDEEAVLPLQDLVPGLPISVLAIQPVLLSAVYRHPTTKISDKCCLINLRLIKLKTD